MIEAIDSARREKKRLLTGTLIFAGTLTIVVYTHRRTTTQSLCYGLLFVFLLLRIHQQSTFAHALRIQFQ